MDITLRSFREWDPLNVRLLHLYDGPIPRRGDTYHDTPAHVFHVWLVRRGRLRVEVERGKPVTATAGQWLINAPRTRRLQSFSADAHILSIWFKAGWPDDAPLFDEGLPLAFRGADAPELTASVEPLLISLGCPASWKQSAITPLTMDLSGAMAVAARFRVFLACWVDALLSRGLQPVFPTVIDPRVAACAAELERPGFFASVPYERLTRLSNLSRVQIDRLFRSELGESPRSYADKQCLGAAMRQLVEGHRSVKEIAFSLGFRTTAHFSAWFRRASGCTPRQHRRAVQDGA